MAKRPVAGSEMFGSLIIDNENNAGYIEYDSDDDLRPESSDDEDEQEKSGKDNRMDDDDDAIQNKTKTDTLLAGIESELDAKMNALQQSMSSNDTKTNDNNDNNNTGDDDRRENDEDAEKKKKDPNYKSNNDLLYDPSIDDDNQKWVDSFRRNLYNPFEGKDAVIDQTGMGNEDQDPTTAAAEANKQKGLKALPTSDALLNCAACMCILCLDCQQHDKYENQFRAMFVHNCKIDRSEKLYFKQKTRQYKSKKDRESENQINADDEVFLSVKCTQCEAVVGVYDTDEIYHFFSVIASPP